MKRFSEQFYKKAKTVKLKKAEQADLRGRIVSYMEYHPLPAEMRSPAKRKVTAHRPLSTEVFVQYKVPFTQLFKFGGMFAAIVLVLVPFMAERAIPGDTLYAVKVNINEEVRSTLTLDPYQKIEWETTLISRRIAEAKLLAKEGRLTEAAEADVAAAVKQHADNAKAEIEILRESDVDEAAIAKLALDSTLIVQAQSFAAVDTGIGGESTDDTIDLIAVAIDESLQKPLGQEVASLPALPNLIARVEQITTRLHELDVTLSSQIDAAGAVDVTRRIEDVERVAAEAFLLPEEATLEAQIMLVDVLTRAQKLIVFMTDLDVREAVAIETVVPVVLTLDEEDGNRAERLLQIDTYLSQMLATEVNDQDLSGKLAVIIERLEIAKTDLLDVSEYDAFIVTSTEALALGKDAMILLEQTGVQIVTPVVGSIATSTDAIASSTATTTNEIIEEGEVEQGETATPTVIEEPQPEEIPKEIVEEVITEDQVDATSSTTSESVELETEF